MSEPGNKRCLSTSGAITNLPDELLCQILRHVDFKTKLQGHALCRQWNEVLENPCRADLWGEMRWIQLKGTLLKNERRRQILHSTAWLARRAAGITHFKIETQRWHFLRADCVAELRSPLLHGNATALSVRSFAPPWEAHQHCPVHRSDPCKPWHSCQCVKGLPKTTYAMQHTSCLKVILLADTEVMTSALMQDHMLLTCLGHDLVSLTLTEHSEDPMLPTVDLDCLSGMSKLQHLYISSNMPGKVWSTQGLLSSLDCLEGFTFLGEGTLQGPLVPALAVLPNLTTLRTSHIPGGRVKSCSAYFTALTSFEVVDTGAEGPQSLHITFGQPLSSLRKLSLTDCHITSMPVSLRLVSSLTRVKFERCSFTLVNWLHQALEGATQVTSLTLRCSGEDGIPDSVFQMVRLQRLKLPYSDLTDLPAEIVQLSNLTCLDLPDNDMRSVP